MYESKKSIDIKATKRLIYMKAHPHDVRILEHQVVELTRVLSDVEEAHLDKADYQNHRTYQANL